MSVLSLSQAVIQVMEAIIIIHRTIIPLTMAIVALTGGEHGISRRLFPSLFLLLSLLLLLLYTQIQLYVRKIHDIITSDTTSTCFARVIYIKRKVQTVMYTYSRFC